MKYNKLIKICLIILIILLLMIIFLFTITRTNTENKSVQEQETIVVPELEEINSENRIIKIEEYINKYLKSLYGEDKSIAKKIFLGDIKEDKSIKFKNFKIQELNMKNDSRGKNYIYLAYGDITQEKEDENITALVEIQFCNTNKTFGVVKPIKYDISKQDYLDIIEEEKKKLSKKDKSDEFRYKDIEKNEENTYVSMDATQKEVAEYYLADFREKINEDSYEAYYLLNEEYKEKKFPEYKDFKRFYNDNKLRFSDIDIDQFVFTNKEYGEQIIIVDKQENYYIFEVNKFMQYKVILDSYMLQNEELSIIYEKENDKGKGIRNIQKIIESIKMGDYEYIYSKMTEGFKKNKYPNKDKFENSMEKIFSGKEFKTEIIDFKNEGNIYIYDVEFKNEKERIIMQILMRLKEKQDFEISFNIK